MRKKRRLVYLLSFFVSILFTLFIYFILLLDNYSYKFSVSGVAIAVFLGVLIGCTTSIFINMYYDILESTLRRKILEYESDNMQSEIEDDIFENSIKMSYKYLDQYYLQTREQAQKGFFVTVCVAVFGAVLIFVGIAAMFFEKVEPSYITCASGVITEFIAAIFFYLYNKTVSSMSKYHNKLVLSQNISIALKVADSLPIEDKAKTKNLIIAELLKDINTHLVKNDSSVEVNK